MNSNEILKKAQELFPCCRFSGQRLESGVIILICTRCGNEYLFTEDGDYIGQ